MKMLSVVLLLAAVSPGPWGDLDATTTSLPDGRTMVELDWTYAFPWAANLAIFRDGKFAGIAPCNAKKWVTVEGAPGAYVYTVAFVWEWPTNSWYVLDEVTVNVR